MNINEDIKELKKIVKKVETDIDFYKECLKEKEIRLISLTKVLRVLEREEKEAIQKEDYNEFCEKIEDEKQRWGEELSYADKVMEGLPE